MEHRVAETLRERLGTSDLFSSLKQDIADVGPAPTRLKNDFSAYFTRPAVTWDEWGRGRIWDSERHYAEYLFPLEQAETLDEIAAYPWPDLNEAYRYQELEQRVEQLHARGLAVRGDVSETTFEIAWQLRSMERLFDDMAHAPEIAALIFDKITGRTVNAARALATAGVDILYTGDDISMQTGLMMSRAMWRKWLRPRLEQVINAAREIRPGLPVQYHSDGKINDLLPDLIEAGVTILNPVQPECVDHSWVKATFGDRLAFDGGLGVQSVLPFGSPEEVREHTRVVIETLGAGGGLVVGPSHVIERDTPLENILAMLNAMDEYGNYE
jgi:uroporphyrinogen decarboxylase